MSATRSEIRHLSSIERELSIVIPSSILEKELGKAYQRLSQKVRIKGFRQGKVPRSVLEQFYRADVEHEVLSSALNLGFKEALSQHDLKPVSEPKVDETPNFQVGADLAFKATVQVKPEIILNKWQGLSVTAPLYTFDEKDVDADLERLRQEHSTLSPVTDRSSIQQGDHVECTVEATLDGEPCKELSHAQGIDVGSGHYFPAAEQALVGSEVGSELNCEVSIAEDFGIEKLRGKKAQLSLKSTSIQLRKFPELDDEFAKDVSERFTNLEELKTAIRDNLQREKDQNDKAAVENALIDALFAENSFEIPSGMIRYQAEYLAANMLQQFGRKQAEQLWKSLRVQLTTEAMPRAERTVRISLLLEAISKAASIVVSDADVDADLAKEAERTNTSIEKLKAAYKPEDIEQVRDRLMGEQAMQAVIDAATVTREPKALRT